MLPTIQIPTLLRHLTDILYLVGFRIANIGRHRSRDDGHYWGVQIVPPASGICCEAAQRLQERSFSLDKAPPLPLWDCTMLRDCHCRYRYLPERRSDQDRPGRIFLELEGPDRRDNGD